MNSRVGTTFGNYRITGLLGKGGMGEVYQAYDTVMGRTVALKILSDQFTQDERFRTRFRRESRAAAILQEPHVIPIHQSGEIDGCLYIDMRLVQGKTLHEMLRRGPLEPGRAVAIISQVASALDAAHAEQLIHRDVKPQNIIVTGEDFAYLVDFGIAETKGDTRLTRTGTQIGTYAYMAPERYLDQPITPAVDVYALACVLYEALTGYAPFPADSLEQLITAHLTSPPPRPTAVNPRLPRSFDEVIARGMAKEPDDRYGSAGAFGRAAQRSLQPDWRMSPQAPAMPASPPTYPAVSHPPVEPPPSYPQFDPQTVPAPQRVTSPPLQDTGRRPGRWVLPTVVAITAVAVLGAIGVVIGMVVKPGSEDGAGPSPTVGSAVPTTRQTLSSPSPSAAQTTSTALPSLVQAPDSYGVTCGQGTSIPNETGFGSRSGRGTAETSCAFADSVLKSYWAQFGRPSRDLRTVSAPGSVACSTVAGARCDPANGANFLMDCAAYGSDNWVTCAGGNNARVYLY
ncbi:MAG: protein kinase [Mycobacteriaceae bacterium]|nr:protein kinase [Mycobacteriaceae bacterium]